MEVGSGGAVLYGFTVHTIWGVVAMHIYLLSLELVYNFMKHCNSQKITSKTFKYAIETKSSYYFAKRFFITVIICCVFNVCTLNTMFFKSLPRTLFI